MQKSDLLRWLQEEYRQWEVFLEQFSPAAMEQGGITGDCSMKDIVIVAVGDKHSPAGEFFDHFHGDHAAEICAWLACGEKE